MNVAPPTGGSFGLDPQALGLDPRALSALAKAVVEVPVEGGFPTPGSAADAVFAADHVLPSLPELVHPAIQELLRVVDERVFPADLRPETQLAESVRVQSPLPARSSHVHAYAVQTPGQSPDGLLIDARESAVRSVGKAARAVEMATGQGSGISERVPSGVDPRIALILANQFIQTGQLANYLRAEELGRLVALWFEGAQPLPFPGGRVSASVGASDQRQRQGALKKLWSRAPLLVLFAAWLLSGLVTAAVFKMAGVRAWENSLVLEIWAVGFLVLVVFQFVATIRGALRLNSTTPRRTR